MAKTLLLLGLAGLKVTGVDVSSGVLIQSLKL